MRKINQYYVFVLLAVLFVSCDTVKEAVDSAVYPKTKGGFDIKSGNTATSSVVPLAALTGTIDLEKEGEGKMKLSLKNFGHSGLEGKLDVDFNVTLSKIESVPAYKIKFDKQDIKKEIPFAISFPLNTAQKTLFKLSVDKIDLSDDIKKMELQTTVEPLVNKVEHKGTKYVGVVYTNTKAKVALDIAFKIEVKKALLPSSPIDDSIFINYIKGNDDNSKTPIREVIKAIYKGSDADAKQVLKSFIQRSIEKLKAGIIQEEGEFILKTEEN